MDASTEPVAATDAVVADAAVDTPPDEEGETALAGVATSRDAARTTAAALARRPSRWGDFEPVTCSL
ncbi:hypothetical protein RU09_16625 [Microbacterium sp. MEJ108Y]|jgi:hypothetical protein|nr:hypothetical protein RU09_16625 [Microbacterium sp. MEJ108Y]